MPINKCLRALVFTSLLSFATAPLWAQESKDPPAPAAAPKKSADKDKPKALSRTEVYRHTLRGTAYIETSDGSGTTWVVDAKRRLLITNEHVIHGSATAKVWFPEYKDGDAINEKRHYAKNVKPIIAQVIDSDPVRDLALLQLESIPDNVAALELAEKSPEPGARLHALGGSPLGSEGLWIYASGEVRAVYRRRHANAGEQIRMIETTVPTNKGNSGGPLMDDFGKLVGVCEGGHTQANLVTWFVDLEELKKYLDLALPMLDPKTAEQFNRRGDRHYQQRRYAQAIRDYTEAFSLDGEMALALANRAWAFYQKGDSSTALADFNDAIRRDSDLVSAYHGRGLVYRRTGKIDESLYDFTEAIRREPDAHFLYNQRGMSYDKARQADKALADYSRAIKLAPDNSVYYVNRGLTYQDLRRYDQSIEDFLAAIKRNDSNAGAYNALGDSFYYQKRFDKAVEAYSLAIRRHSGSSLYYSNRAVANRMLKRYEDARQDYIASLERNSKNAWTFNGLGLTYYDAGKYDLALDAFKKAANLDGSQYLFYRNQGYVYRRANRHEQAIPFLNKAISLRSNDAELYALRGWSNDSLGNRSSALADYKRAQELDSSYKIKERRYLRVQNASTDTINVYAIYRTLNSDGKWSWFPAGPGGGNHLYYQLKPGEDFQLLHDEFKINGSRVRLWARGANTTKVWYKFKNEDLWICPKGGYLSTDGKLESYTYTFYD